MINSRVEVKEENIFPREYRCKCGCDHFRVFVLPTGTLGTICFGCNLNFHFTLKAEPQEVKIVGGAVPTVKA